MVLYLSRVKYTNTKVRLNVFHSIDISSSFRNQEYHSAIILQSFCNHSAIILQLFCNRSAIILQSFCNHSAIILQSYTLFHDWKGCIKFCSPWGQRKPSAGKHANQYSVDWVCVDGLLLLFKGTNRQHERGKEKQQRQRVVESPCSYWRALSPQALCLLCFWEVFLVGKDIKSAIEKTVISVSVTAQKTEKRRRDGPTKKLRSRD